jgi:hypothetical protein
MHSIYGKFKRNFEFEMKNRKETTNRRDITPLSNTKLILYEYDVENVWEQLEEIDAVLREISLSEGLDDKDPPMLDNIPVDIPPEKSTPVMDNLLEVPQKRLVKSKKKVLVSLPYNLTTSSVAHSIQTAALIHLQDNRASNKVCSYCKSTEVLQTNQLYEISHWRKTTMKELNQVY